MPFFSLSSPTSGNATQLQARNVSATAPATGSILTWSGSAWVPGTGQTGPAGAKGDDGSKLLNGSGVPSDGYGRSGDYYLNTSGALYGPKADGSWGTPLQLQSGPQGPTGGVGATGPAGQSITGPAGAASTVTGPTGAVGAVGPTGVRGNTVLGGNGAPASSVGIDGDWYIDTAARRMYGPKSGGAWGGSFAL